MGEEFRKVHVAFMRPVAFPFFSASMGLTCETFVVCPVGRLSDNVCFHSVHCCSVLLIVWPVDEGWTLRRASDCLFRIPRGGGYIIFYATRRIKCAGLLKIRPILCIASFGIFMLGREKWLSVG